MISAKEETAVRSSNIYCPISEPSSGLLPHQHRIWHPHRIDFFSGESSTFVSCILKFWCWFLFFSPDFYFLLILEAIFIFYVYSHTKFSMHIDIVHVYLLLYLGMIIYELLYIVVSTSPPTFPQTQSYI